MPQPKQDEYRSLKEQIAQLEKKKKEQRKGNILCQLKLIDCAVRCNIQEIVINRKK